MQAECSDIYWEGSRMFGTVKWFNKFEGYGLVTARTFLFTILQFEISEIGPYLKGTESNFKPYRVPKDPKLLT